MSANAVQNFLIGRFNEAPINKSMGLSLEYNSVGEAIVRMPRNPGFDHGLNDTHGGAITVLLDSAGWFTTAAQCRKSVLTSDLQVRLLQPAKQQDLIAHATILRAGSKMAVAEMRVTTSGGDLVAVGSASFSIMGELPPL